jgi:uncharacterized DUF497 family protein
MTAHPSRAEAWKWDEGNESELAAHGISPAEVYEVWANSPSWAPNARHRSGDWKMCGRTDGGRRLAIVVGFYPDRGLLRAITGWDATPSERSKYFKGD